MHIVVKRDIRGTAFLNPPVASEIAIGREKLGHREHERCPQRSECDAADFGAFCLRF